jgi:protein-S-isoprenylcysteine O-methyltransferase Ste14
MQFFFEAGFWIAWIVMYAVWLVAARLSKPAARTTSSAMRILQSTIFIAGFFLISGYGHLGQLSRSLWPQTLAVAVAGLAITFAGVAFAIWARLTLGSNWSGKPMVKQGHELIVSGPYALARHPIYTGMLLATVGTSIGVDQWRCVAGVALVLFAFAAKMRQEERLMNETFPDAYPAYRRRVKALIPGLF